MWLFGLFFLSSASLICRGTDISKYFRDSLGIRDNESRLYFHHCVLHINETILCLHLKSVFLHSLHHILSRVVVEEPLSILGTAQAPPPESMLSAHVSGRPMGNQPRARHVASRMGLACELKYLFDIKSEGPFSLDKPHAPATFVVEKLLAKTDSFCNILRFRTV